MIRAKKRLVLLTLSIFLLGLAYPGNGYVWAQETELRGYETLPGFCARKSRPNPTDLTIVDSATADLAEEILGQRPTSMLTVTSTWNDVERTETRFYTRRGSERRPRYICLGQREQQNGRFAESSKQYIHWTNGRGQNAQAVIYYYEINNPLRPLVAISLRGQKTGTLNIASTGIVDSDLALDGLTEEMLWSLVSNLNYISRSTKNQENGLVLSGYNNEAINYEFISLGKGRRYIFGEAVPVPSLDVSAEEKQALADALKIKFKRINRLVLYKEVRNGTMNHYADFYVDPVLGGSGAHLGGWTNRPWQEIRYFDKRGKLVGIRSMVNVTQGNDSIERVSWFNGRGPKNIGKYIMTVENNNG